MSAPAKVAAATTDDVAANSVGGPAAAFGLAAAITIVFNTLLAWAKDAYEPLNSYMASLTGHHWRTHGVVDVVVFVALGYYFLSRKIRIDGVRLAALLAVAAVVAGGGLALWFVLV